MTTAAPKLRTIAAWLFAMLLIVSAPHATAKPFTVRAARKIFTSSQAYQVGNNIYSINVSIEGYTCLLLSDREQSIRYVIVLSTTKWDSGSESMRNARPIAMRLTDYISQEFCKAKLIPFADGKSGCAIAVGNRDTDNSPTSIVGLPTIDAIDRLIAQGGSFYSFSRPDTIMLRMPCPISQGNYCYVGVPLYYANADFLILYLGPSARESFKTITQAAGSILRLGPIARATASPYYHFGECLANYAGRGVIVEYNGSYVVGSNESVAEYVLGRDTRRRKEFMYSSPSSPFPLTEKAAQEARKEQAANEERARLFKARSVAGLGEYLGCGVPNKRHPRYGTGDRHIRGGRAYFKLRGCQLVIPVPYKLGTGEKNRLSLPFRVFFIRSNEGDSQKSLELANGLVQMANLGKTETIVYEKEGIVKVIVEDGIAPRFDITPADFPKIFAVKEFYDSQSLDWPNKTITGEPMPLALKKALETVTINPIPLPPASDKPITTPAGDPSSSPSPLPPASGKPITTDSALSDYIEYLRQLTNER